MAPVVMVIAPHPDDAEIGMGGTIAKFLAEGNEVVLVDLTNGEPTPFGTPEIRARESSAASEILGLKHRVCLGLTNREVFDTVENRKLLATLIRQHKPELLFIPYWEDAHPDHIQACALCEGARFYSKFVKTDMPFEPHFPRKVFHFFSTHIRVRFNPSFVLDITPFFEQKMKAITAYESQFSHTPVAKRAVDLMRAEASYWGAQVGVLYGEPFVCRESIRVTTTAQVLSS